MKTRRQLLQYTTAALAAVPFTKALGQSKDAKKEKPIVVSTWNFGVQANDAAWQILGHGGKALDAIIAGVAVPEADPKNNSVGYGGLPGRDGHVTLDACGMGKNGGAGSGVCVEHIIHVAALARKVMEKPPHVMLVADGALQFALDNGFEKQNLLTPESGK